MSLRLLLWLLWVLLWLLGVLQPLSLTVGAS